MNPGNPNIRALIRQIIQENIMSETQKSDKIDSELDRIFSEMTPNQEILGRFNPEAIKQEVKNLTKHKISKIMGQTFYYPDFYIIKLGNFVIKTNDGIMPCSFERPRETKKFSFPFIYVFRDKIIFVNFGSDFFDTDDVMMKKAMKFINDKKIHLDFKNEKGVTEKGHVKLESGFHTDNVIDLVDYSKIKAPEPEKKAPTLAKEKSSYRVGQPIKHEKFGKGVITKTKSAGSDAEGSPLFDVTVQFEDKPRTLRMKPKKTGI